MYEIIRNPELFSIQPRDINAREHFWNAFENHETEVSAGYIVRMCQEKGSWFPFTMDEIQEHYDKAGHAESFSFNALVNPMTKRQFGGGSHVVPGGYLVQGDDGRYYITVEFVLRCFRSLLRYRTCVAPTAREAGQ